MLIEEKNTIKNSLARLNFLSEKAFAQALTVEEMQEYKELLQFKGNLLESFGSHSK